MSEIAIIGGTGLDESAQFTSGEKAVLMSPFGKVDACRVRLGNASVIFVPRHGFDHRVSPNSVNYKAIVAALAIAGADKVFGVCAVGSLRQDLPPGSVVVLTDFLDFTRGRDRSFYDAEDSHVVHTDFTHPYCPTLSSALRSAQPESADILKQSTIYAAVDGPRYETPAEIRMYSSLGGDVIGMTNIPEAVLAREAGLCYAALAVVTNLAAGISTDLLNHEHVRAAMQSAMPRVTAMIEHAVEDAAGHLECDCRLRADQFRDIFDAK